MAAEYQQDTGQETTIGQIKDHLNRSVIGLITRAGEASDSKTLLLPQRYEVGRVFLDAVWEELDPDDKYEFARVLYHNPSSKFINEFEDVEWVDVMWYLDGRRTEIHPELLKKIYRVTRENMSLRWETIRDKEGEWVWLLGAGEDGD